MATWKKVIVSGSTANLAALQVDNLTLNQVVIGGGQATNLSTRAINGGGSIVATSGSTGLSMSGSFSGSFFGQITSSLNNQSTAFYVAYNTTTGQFTYSSTSSISSNSASYAATSSTILITDQPSGAGPYYLTFVSNTGSAQILNTDSALLVYNSSTNVLSTTASVAITASNASSASFVTGSIYTAGNLALSASYSITASFALTASWANNFFTASVTNASTASYARTVGAGALISSSTDIVSVVTSSLGAGQIPKYINNTLSGSNITDTGNQIQIGAGASAGVTVAAGGINVTGNSTFNNNVVVSGDLTVAGTASFQNTQNLLIGDRFAALASGSTTLTDGGIIVISSTSAAGMSGSAFFLESVSSGLYGRWAVASNVHASASTVAADEYAVTAKILQVANPVDATPPTWGSSTTGMGNMWITNAGEIFIYS